MSHVAERKRLSKWAQASERRLTPRSWLEGVWRQWPLLISLSIVGVGLLVVSYNHFLRGTVIIAFGVCVAAFLRLVLSDEQAGVLRIRSKAIDVLTLSVLGLGTLIAALIVPPPS
jgi:hypothetical protein